MNIQIPIANMQFIYDYIHLLKFVKRYNYYHTNIHR